MLVAMTDSETEILKLVRVQLVTSETRSVEHVTTTFRWLMATLFAANGCAMVTLFGASEAHSSSATLTAISDLQL